jgi:hypothetical protein
VDQPRPRQRESKTDPYRTLEVVQFAEARRSKRRARLRRAAFGYAAAAGVGALLAAFGVWIGSRTPRVSVPGSGPLGESVQATLSIPVLPPAPPPKVVESRPPQPEPARIPAVVVVDSPERVAAPAARPKHPRPALRIAAASPGRELPKGGISPVTSPRYCARVDETLFHPPASDDPETVVRPDGGLMRVIVSIDGVAEGYPGFISVLFENGGDSSVVLDRLESSSSGGALRPVSSAHLPARVAAGGLRELYRYPLSPSAGEPDGRRFVVVDPKGDSWSATVRRVPCEN